MTFEEIKQTLAGTKGTEVISGQVEGLQPQLIIPKEFFHDVCVFLFSNEQLYFDTLSCITGLDLGPDKGKMEVIYNFYSIPYNHHLVVKVELERAGGESLPSISSVVDIWATANWHEREVFDLLGINFEGHPDLRRILLPADWEGYPLRKDYHLQEYYHGIKTRY